MRYYELLENASAGASSSGGIATVATSMNQKPIKRGVYGIEENYRVDMVDEFTRAYMQAMLWAETDNSNDQGGDPLDQNYDETDFSDDAMERIINDCKQFQQQAQLENYSEEIAGKMAGHDFWLTRVGHGAGFWDGDWPEAEGKRLTDLSEKFGNVDVYVGDDGQLELM